MRFARAAALIVIASATSLIGGPATAACHSFYFGDDPDKTVSVSVKEGDAIEVTVSRDAAVADSAVHVQSVDGTAKAGSDYNEVDTHVEFTGESTQETVTVVTKEDAKHEGNETFQLKLGNAEGCAVNPNYTYGQSAKITIVDDDPAPKTATPKPNPTATPAATEEPSPTPTETPEPTGPSATPSVPPTGEPEETVTETFAPPEVTTSGGGFPWLPVLAVVGFLAAGGGALILTRLRRGV